MKNTGRRNILDLVLDEYVAWGGPIVTRREALADARLRGFSDAQIDYCIFGRREVEAPADPAWHSDFLYRIQVMDGLVAVAA